MIRDYSGDYKNTANPRLEREEFPLPTIDELFASMTQGKNEVSPECREMLTLTTTDGLFQPTRLMNGISSAP
jgi:hypothetical protein